MSNELRIAVRDAPTGARIRTEHDAWQLLVDGALERTRAEGFEAGRKSNGAEVDRAVEAIAETNARAADALAATAVSLARSIAERIVRFEIEAGRYDLERIVRETLASTGIGRGEVSVHLHPSDAASLADISFRQGTTIESDVEVPRGHVHVDTPLGLLVRNVDEMLAAIVERIREESGA